MLHETERLTLRVVTPQDLDAVSEYMSDPEVCRLTAAGPFDRRDTALFLERLANRDGGRRRWDGFSAATGGAGGSGLRRVEPSL